jgi:hypothetical protein
LKTHRITQKQHLHVLDDLAPELEVLVDKYAVIIARSSWHEQAGNLPRLESTWAGWNRYANCVGVVNGDVEITSVERVRSRTRYLRRIGAKRTKFASRRKLKYLTTGDYDIPQGNSFNAT